MNSLCPPSDSRRKQVGDVQIRLGGRRVADADSFISELTKMEHKDGGGKGDIVRDNQEDNLAD